MKFDVYCDESRPDVLSTKQSTATHLVIGSLWLPTDLRTSIKADIHILRDKYKIGGEFKWQKVSPSRLDFYRDLIDLFIARDEDLRFRCIAVEKSKLNLLRFHNNDQELGFYKFYYQVLHHWILDFNEYSVFCDFKSNRVGHRLPELAACLRNANLSSCVSSVQAVRSSESVLIQLADVLTGMAAAKMNDSLKVGGAKWHLVSHFEQGLKPIRPTYRSENKFNVFKINLDGGW